MASRNYGLAYDTPYNREIAKEQIENMVAQSREGNTIEGNITEFDYGMSGGAYLGKDGKVHTTSSRSYTLGSDHPHLHLLGATQSGGNWKSIVHSIAKDVVKPIGSAAGDVFPGPVNPFNLGYDLGYNVIGPALVGNGIPSGGRRPPGFVPSWNASSGKLIPGTSANYPLYNSIEMAHLSGMGVHSGGNIFKDIGKGLSSVGKAVAPVALDIGKELAVDAAKAALMGAGVKRRGRPRKQGRKDREDEKLGMEVADLKKGGKFNLGKTLKSVGKVVAPIAVDVAKDAAVAALMGAGVESGGKFNVGKAIKGAAKSKVGQAVIKEGKKQAVKQGSKMAKDAVKSYLEGSGSGDGRKRRAEIVKKVMKEKGLKLAQASKYVKEKGLY